MFLFDSLAISSIVVYVVLWAVTLLAAPKRDLAQRGSVNLWLTLAGTLLAYAAGSIWVFLAGWLITALPSLTGARIAPKASVWTGLAALAGGATMLTLPSAMIPGETGQIAVFGLLVLAAMLRSGIFPFQFWTTHAFESSSLPSLNVRINSHLGAYLLVRFAIPLLPGASQLVLPRLHMLALFGALYAAVRAVAETRPRQILALLYASQTSLIFAGLATGSIESITGALVYWWVTALAITGLIVSYRAVEARTTEVESPAGYLGLSLYAPRLAIFFAVFGLASVGIPGTAGFAAEDLLIQGMHGYSWAGVALLLTTMLNAITFLRLFAKLFLGRRATHTPPIPDAGPTERWGLSLLVVMLVGAGLAPSLVIAVRAPVADWLLGILAGR